MLQAICILLCFQLIQGKPLEQLTGANDPRPLCPCGSNINSIHTRVVGGHDSERRSFSYASGLVFNLGDFDIAREMATEPFCGATLITDRHVLTAAHCIRDRSPSYISVDAADYSLRDATDGQLIPSKKLTLYPEYKMGSFHTDIGIIELRKPVKFDANTRTAWLPNPNMDLKPGTTVSVYGWGKLNYTGKRPDLLQTVDLPVVDNKKCQTKFISRIEDRMLCAGGEIGRDACIGDSGSGLVVRLNNDYVLCGIVSFGRRCALPGVPGVYTKVSSFVNWILKHTRSASCKPCVHE